MLRTCPKCNTIERNDFLVACPKCYSPFLSHDLSLEQEKHLARVFRKEFFRDLAWWISLTVLILGGSIVQLHRAVLDRVDEEFKEPRIKTIVDTAAKTEAQGILREEIEPKVSEFKQEVGGKVESFTSFLQRFEGKFKDDYQTLSKEVSTLEQRNHLVLLGDKAITDGSRQAFEELRDFAKTSTETDLVVAANAEEARVISFWGLMSRAGGASISVQLPDGTEKKDAELSTSALLDIMLNNTGWKARAVSANLLGNRSQKGVPEALLSCAQKDEHLEVVRNAIRSFQSVTGCGNITILEIEPLEIWWKDHSKEVNDKLTEPQ